MKRRLHICLLGLLLNSLAHAQSERPITELLGRYVRAEVSLSGSFLGMGGSIAPLGGLAASQADASCLSWNPAALPLLAGRSAVLDWVPGANPEVSGLLQLASTVNEQMDAVIDDYGAFSAVVAYPRLSVRAGPYPMVSGCALAVPLTVAGRRWGIGIGYREPFALHCTLAGTGLEVALDSEQEVQGEARRIRMRTWLDVSADLQAKTQEVILGLGGQLGPATTFGVSLTRMALRAECNAYAAVEGIVEMSGGEYAFNDPYDPRIDFARDEQNDLHQSFFADYAGEVWGVRLGLLHRVSQRFQVGLTVSAARRMRLSGEDSTVNNRVPFIRMEGGAGGDVEDLIDATKINLAKLTLTERLASRNAFLPELRVPASFHFGCRWGSNKTALSVRLSAYAGELSVAFKEGQKRGVRLRYGAALGLDVRYFFMAVSSELGEEIRPSDAEGSPLQNLPVPRFVIGARAPLLSELWLTGLLGMDPIPFMRLSGRYEF